MDCGANRYMRKQIILEYIKAINEADITKLYSLMGSDYIFIDAHGEKIIGKDAMKQSWVGYL